MRVTYHDTGPNTIGMNRLRREEKVGVFLESGIDIAIQLSTSETKRNSRYILCVAVPGDDAVVDTLKKTSQLPSSRSTLGMSTQTLLRHDRNSIACCTVEVGEDIVPDVCLVGFIGTCTRAVDG